MIIIKGKLNEAKKKKKKKRFVYCNPTDPF